MGKLAAAILSLACTSPAYAQIEENPSPASPSPEQDVTGRAEPPANGDNMTTVHSDRDYASLRRYIVVLEDRIDDLERRLAQLADLEPRVLANSAQIETLSDQEQTANGVLGAVPRNSELRRQFGAAAQGKVHVVNYTGQEKTIYVNGVRWNALKGRSYVYSPVGRVALQSSATCEPTIRDDWAYEDGELQMTFEIYD